MELGKVLRLATETKLGIDRSTATGRGEGRRGGGEGHEE
jgi:hypothetical protein